MRSSDRRAAARVLCIGVVLAAAELFAADASVVSFEVTASRFRFDPATFEVTQGDRMRLTLRSADGTHGIEIPGLKIKAKIPKGGEPVLVEFMAAKVGTFPFECSEYCGAGHRGMKGTLVVRAK